MGGRGGALLLGLAVLALGGDVDPASPEPGAPITACEGRRPALPRSLLYELREGAFPGSGRPDVAVHVPPGFDATRRPGLVVYFHGWNGCAEAALADEDAPCSEAGEARMAARLAEQLDEARVNAVLAAVELRVDLPTGEPGQLASPAGLRALVEELLHEHLAAALGGEEEPCPLEVDGLDRIVVVAHSGGYQAAAGVLARGDVPQISEVVLLDALYGADDVFAAWVRGAVDGFDGSRRFVDLYTCCGGTLERSRAVASMASLLPGSGVVFDDDGESELELASLARPVVFKRVPRAHAVLPSTYMSAIFQHAGFAPLRSWSR